MTILEQLPPQWGSNGNKRFWSWAKTLPNGLAMSEYKNSKKASA